MNTTLTSSPYFSPNKAKAPILTASFGVIILVWTSDEPSTISLTILFILAISWFSIGLLWLKSNLNLSGETNDPFCITCFPNVLLKDSCNK